MTRFLQDVLSHEYSPYPRSISSLRGTAVPWQDRHSLRNLRFTYTQFAERASRLAGALREAGVKAGDRVAFLSLNCHRLLEAYYGVLEAGAVLLPLNIRLAPQELAYILNDAGAKILFLEKEFVSVVDSFRQTVSNVQSHFMLDAAPQAPWLSPKNYEDVLAAASALPRGRYERRRKLPG